MEKGHFFFFSFSSKSSIILWLDFLMSLSKETIVPVKPIKIMSKRVINIIHNTNSPLWLY
jgi:hypothetical protein